MKKIVIILSIVILILSMKKSNLIIPEDAIRFRIIANSDEKVDQDLKKQIIKVIWKDLLVNKKNINEARAYLKDNVPYIEEKISKVIDKNNFSINYGKNYFPKKEYKNVEYPEGEYESLVVKIGEGKGKNFWCVLFPPLCLIDEDENVEYKSIIKEVLNAYR